MRERSKEPAARGQDPRFAVLAAGDDDPAVRRERRGEKRLRPRRDRPEVGDGPQPCVAVQARGRDRESVRAELGIGDGRAPRAAQDDDRVSVARLLDACRPVGAGRDEEPRVATERHVVDRVQVSVQRGAVVRP